MIKLLLELLLHAFQNSVEQNKNKMLVDRGGPNVDTETPVCNIEYLVVEYNVLRLFVM